jgi:hypothetical protein
MSDLLGWTAIQLNRRRFIKRLAGLTFGAFAGLAAGTPQLALADGCTAYGGGGACAGTNCSGSACQPGGGVDCFYCYGCCGDGACWTSGPHTCCDCRCNAGGVWYYCYCHG